MKGNTKKGYTVNHFNRTITLTRNFSNKASIPGTEEYRIFLSLRRDNPEYEVIQRTIAKKEDKKKAPTYAQMLQYIACVENSDFYMARFEAMRAEAESKNGRSRFGYHTLCAASLMGENKLAQDKCETVLMPGLMYK